MHRTSLPKPTYDEVTAPFASREVSDLASEWEFTRFANIVDADKSSLNPQDFPGELFDYYSIPAYQVGLVPAVEKGAKILSQKLLVENGTVLFGKLNPRVPKVWQVIGEATRRRIASTEFIPLSPRRGRIISDFLYYLCWSDSVMSAAQELVSGSTPSRQRVDVRAFLNLTIMLPPLPEQKGIAYILRTVQRAKEATEKVIAATRQLKQNLMRHLFTYGPVPFDRAHQVELKETEVGAIPVEWNVVSVGDVVTQAQYGLSKRGGQSGKFPILRMNNLVSGRVTTSDLQFVNLEDEEFAKLRLYNGDILFNRTNSFDLVGKTSIFDLPGEYVFASYLIRVTPDRNLVDSRYLNYYLNLDLTQARLKQLATRAVSQSNINATKLRGLHIPLPKRSTQQEMADSLSGVDYKLASEEIRKEALDTLFKSFLRYLMTGKVRVNNLAISEKAEVV